jgi:hypothetical protein
VHESNQELDWSETYSFNFYDKEKDICGLLQIALKPNRNQKEAYCYFMPGDGNLVGLSENIRYDGPAINVKGLSLEELAPERRWGLEFSGGMSKTKERMAKKSHVEFSLEFEAANEIFDHRGSSDKTEEQLTERLEQFGRVTGTLAIGLDEYSIKGLGQKAHTWGVRDWSDIRSWTTVSCQFSEDMAIGLNKFNTSRREVASGFLHLHGTNVAIKKADIRTSLDPDGSVKSFELTLQDQMGETHKFSASIIRKTKLPFPCRDDKSLSMMHETLTRFSFGGKIGYGIVEYLVSGV